MPKKYLTDIERLVAKIKVGKASGCWLWTAAIDPNGYAVFTLDRKKIHGHRAAYLLFIGPIPAGLQLDHEVCDTKHCVNPWHLTPTTGRLNTLRCPDAPAAKNAAKELCVDGHQLAGTNLYVTPNGRRQCRICNRRRTHEYRRRRSS